MHRKNKVVMMMKVQNVNYRPQAYTCVDGGQRQEREAQGHDGSTAHVTTSCKSLHVPGRCGEENVSWTAGVGRQGCIRWLRANRGPFRLPHSLLPAFAFLPFSHHRHSDTKSYAPLPPHTTTDTRHPVVMAPPPAAAGEIKTGKSLREGRQR